MRVRRVRRMGRHAAAVARRGPPRSPAMARPVDIGVRPIPVDEIRGTAVGGGDQRGGDFLPLKPFRGENWQARWQRLRKAQENARRPAADRRREVRRRILGARRPQPGRPRPVRRPAGDRRVGRRARPARRPADGDRSSSLAAEVEAARPMRDPSRASNGPTPSRMIRRLQRRRGRIPSALPDRRAGRPIRWLVVSDDEDPALSLRGQPRATSGTSTRSSAPGTSSPITSASWPMRSRVPSTVRARQPRSRWPLGGVGRPELAACPAVRRRCTTIDGVPVMALEWPGLRHGDRRRHDGTARTDVVRIAAGEPCAALLGGRASRRCRASHAPPRGVGDRAADPYHVGFGAYRWLLDRVRPPLWLHGHVPPASVEGWRIEHGSSTVVNVTGAVLVELLPPGIRPPDAASPDAVSRRSRRRSCADADAARTAARGWTATSGRGTGTDPRPAARHPPDRRSDLAPAEQLAQSRAEVAVECVADPAQAGELVRDRTARRANPTARSAALARSRSTRHGPPRRMRRPPSTGRMWPPLRSVLFTTASKTAIRRRRGSSSRTMATTSTLASASM